MFIICPEQDFNVQVKIIKADFGKGQVIFSHIAKELEKIDIGILGSYYL